MAQVAGTNSHELVRPNQSSLSTTMLSSLSLSLSFSSFLNMVGHGERQASTTTRAAWPSKRMSCSHTTTGFEHGIRFLSSCWMGGLITAQLSFNRGPLGLELWLGGRDRHKPGGTPEIVLWRPFGKLCSKQFPGFCSRHVLVLWTME